MALQVSSRVKKTMAAQICAGLENQTTSDVGSRLAFAFIRNDVPIPTQSSEIFGFLNTALNHSNYGGAMNTNEAYVLATYVFPDLNKELQYGQSNSDPTVISYIGPTTITAKQSGTVGSIIAYVPNLNTTGGYCFSNSDLVNTSVGSDPTNTVLPKGTASGDINAYLPLFFRGMSFITDSIGLPNSNAAVKLSTLDFVQGQTLTFHSISVKVSSFNQ